MNETNQQPRVAVLGCGYWGKNLVRNFSEQNALAAIHDPNPEVADEICERFGVPHLDIDQIMTDDTIDAVSIVVPAAHHFDVADAALDAGKHVLVEKPLCLTADDGFKIVAKAQELGLTLMVGHQFQYHPAFVRLREMVNAGELGRLEYLYSNQLNLGKFRREENTWWSFAPHDISMILSLVSAEPESVNAIGGAYLHKTLADVTNTHMWFPTGQQAHIFVSWLHPYKERKLVVVGERGMAVFNDGEPWPTKLKLYQHGIEWLGGIPTPERAEAENVVVDEEEPLAAEVAHFLECVATGKTPTTDGAEGLRVLRVMEAAQRSMAAGEDQKAVGLTDVAEPTAYSSPGVMVHESAYVEQPVQIGTGTRIWYFTHVMSGAQIGRECNIGQNVFIGSGAVVGDRCKIQNNVSVYDGVVLGDGVFCGPSCVFTNVMNPRAEIERKDEFEHTYVGNSATIGANATIVCGTTIGEHAFIGAGAVVTDDVPAHALMAGVPARRIGWVGRAGERLDADLVCPRTGEQYREVGPHTLESV